MTSLLAPLRPGRRGVSLIETLVVLFIIGIMMGLLLPTLSRVRTRTQVTVCENNVAQLRMGLMHFIQAKRKFPRPGRWTVDLLPYIEQKPLAEEIAASRDPNAPFPRPAVMVCPLQSEFSSRIEGVGFCHYLLVVDRPVPLEDDGKVPWMIEDRELLDGDLVEEPWWVGPEISFTGRDRLRAEKPSPHVAQGFF